AIVTFSRTTQMLRGNSIERGGKRIKHLTPLSELQQEVLKRLGLDSALYQDLEDNGTCPLLL
ncbi:MAG: hypothetical protein QME81_15085, partial [bacterium]|nr:hypothetical protein [bacterium]